MKKIATLALAGVLLVGTVACNSASTDKTSANAPETTASTSASPNGTGSSTTTSSPNSTATTGASPTVNAVKDNKNDATSKVRRDQLNSDIRAREQRNNVTGGDADRASGDLSSEIRSKLEANIPNGSLTVSAKDGAVVVSGTVPAQNQLAKIEPLVKQIKGVKSVKIAAKVAPATKQ